MSNASQLRSRYARESVTTASPARIVTMLYDRLLRDIDHAEQAISAVDHQAAHTALRHAQDIVDELSSSLDLRIWPGGVGLQSLYIWLIEQLVAANLNKDASLLAGCREVVDPLREAWHEAANAQNVAS